MIKAKMLNVCFSFQQLVLAGLMLLSPMLTFSQRSIQQINADWYYLEDNTENLKEALDQTSWESIQLPHTWNQWDVTDNLPGYRRDASWYKKQIKLPKLKNKRCLLYFEGANINSSIYVNQKKVFTHIGGYVGFEVDITDYVKAGKKNEIQVRVDNAYNPDVIPSQKSDFFIYGGLTRDVYLKIVPETYLKEILVSTPEVSKEKANIEVKVSMNQDQAIEKANLLFQLLDPQTQKVILEHRAPIQSQAEGTYTLPSIQNPKLWSPDQPHLYELQVQLVKDQKTIDQTKESIGFRWFHFERNGPFFLNGERLLLRGTHRHEEHAGLGAAMSNELHRRDIEMIKEMGANFVRLGHYPQDPSIYKACNELGLIVWDELPWCRGGKGTEKWEANTLRLLEEQITQNYNHPSILFWSLGNEIYWLPDFPGGDQPEALNAFLEKLNQKAHQLDPKRMTAIRKYYDGAHIVDAFSPSIWSGWYAGVYKNYETAVSDQIKKYPHFLHMEYGGSSHVGRHTENPITGDGSLLASEWTEAINQANVKNIAKEGDWSENYIVDLFDWHLSVSETKDWFPGNAQWAFKDFGTPLRPENAIPYVNQKGLVDRAGKPKDAYYVFKSYWSKDPFVYIESATWTERQGPKGKERSLSVFSNCEAVSLTLNGTSLGKKEKKLGQFPASGLNWDLTYKEGNNELIATGFIDGKPSTKDTLNIQYFYDSHGKPDKIVLTCQKMTNGNYLVTATMRDKDGRRVLDYEDYVYFSSDGDGELYVNYGTPTRSRVVQMANGQAQIEFKPGQQSATIEARNQDFKGSYMRIER